MKRIGVFFIIALLFGAFALILTTSDSQKSYPETEQNQITPQETTQKHTVEELGLTFTTPKEYFVRSESLLNLTTNRAYAYTFFVQNYESAPTEAANYQLYALYQFDGDRVYESAFTDLEKQLDNPRRLTVGGLPALEGQIKGERARYVTYVLKDGYLLTLLTAEPTSENKKRTDEILRTFEFSE